MKALGVAQQIIEPGPGLGLCFRERGAGPAVALDMALGQLNPARQQTGHKVGRREARCHVSGAQLTRQLGHMVVGLGIKHEDPRVGRTVEHLIEVLKPFRGMPSQVDQHDGAGQAGQ